MMRSPSCHFFQTPRKKATTVVSLLIIASVLLVAAASYCGVAAWSPSERPSIFEGPTNPSGLKFGGQPERTKCCFRQGPNALFCVTDGSRDNRAKVKKFDTTGGVLDLVDEMPLDENDIYRVSKCSFLLAAGDPATATKAYAGFTLNYEEENPEHSGVFAIDLGAFTAPDEPTTFISCRLENPSLGAVAIQEGYIAATGPNGLRRMNMNVQPMGPGPGGAYGTCEEVQLEYVDPDAPPSPPPDPMMESEFGSIYGGYIPQNGGSANNSYWVTATGLFQYDVGAAILGANISLANGTARQSLFADGPSDIMYVYTAWEDWLGCTLPNCPAYVRHIHIINHNTFSLVDSIEINTELVGFIGVDGTNLYSCVRKPDFEAATFDMTNWAAGPTKKKIAGPSASDSGAVLPTGADYYKQGDLPTVFAFYNKAQKNFAVFTVPRLKPEFGEERELPSLGMMFGFTPNERTAHFVFRAGADDVASSVIGEGSFFVVLACTPGLIVQIAADNLKEVKAEFQLNMLESTDNRLDTTALIDPKASLLYVQGITVSANNEPAFVQRFDVKSGTMDKMDVLLLWGGRLAGVLVAKFTEDRLYVAGQTDLEGKIYIEEVNLDDGGVGNMASIGTLWIYGMGSEVKSARLDASATHLLIATDTVALLEVEVYPVMTNDTMRVIRAGGEAVTMEADPYGFVTIGYNGYNGQGSIAVVHPASGKELVLKQNVESSKPGPGGGKTNVNLLRRTDDDNIIGLSISEEKRGPDTVQVTTAYTTQLDLITPGVWDWNIKFASVENLPWMPNAMTAATANGFTFTLGRDKGQSTVAIFRSGSKTNKDQDKILWVKAKRGELIFAKNPEPMTWDEANQYCKTWHPRARLAELGSDHTERDAIQGLMDQHPIWVAGRYREDPWMPPPNNKRWMWGENNYVDPPYGWWGPNFPFEQETHTCAYIRQGRLFNAHCNHSKFFPACVLPFEQVNRTLVHESIPESPWIIVNGQNRFGTLGSVFGLRRVDFEDNFFTCVNRPWDVDIDWACGAAWDTAVFGPPVDVQMVAYNQLFVATKTSLYQLDLDLGTQNLVRQYTTFKRPMTLVQKWNLTIVYGETRTDFFSMIAGRRVTRASLRKITTVWPEQDETCDVVEFVTARFMLCISKSQIVRYRYHIDPVSLDFDIIYSSKKVLIDKQLQFQQRPVTFQTTDEWGLKSLDNKGLLKMSIFSDLVVQPVAFNESLTSGPGPQAEILCNLVGRNSGVTANLSSAGPEREAFASLSVRLPQPGEQNCDGGRWQNCVKNQLPLNREQTFLDCSAGTDTADPGLPPSSTLTWTEKILADIGSYNGQVSHKYQDWNKPKDAPEQVFQITATAVTDGVVTIAFHVKNFPCLNRGSDFSSYCMSTIEQCDPEVITGETCYETFAYGGVKFGKACDVARYCNATVLTALNVKDPQLTDLLNNAKTFSGDLDTLLQFNLTGEMATRVASYDNRVAAFQNLGDPNKITWDQSTSWLKRDSPIRAFHLMHPTVATKSDSATAAALMTDSEAIFWKRSTTIKTKPGAPPIHFTVVTLTDDADEKDNVLYCNQFTRGYVKFAPFVLDPDAEMPPLVVDGVAPKWAGTKNGFWESSEVPLWPESWFRASDGMFEVSINCSTTTVVHLFLNFTDGATYAIPFYTIGKNVAKGADAGAPPQVKEYGPLPPTAYIPTYTTDPFTGELSGLSTATNIADVAAVVAGLAAVPNTIELSFFEPLGSFVLSDACPAELGAVQLMPPPGKPDATNKVKITLADQANLDAVVTECISFFPSPSALVRDETPVANRMAAFIDYGGQMGNVALSLDMVRRNTGPVPGMSVCNTTITVGHDKIAYLGQVFRSPVGKDLQISSKITYRGKSTIGAQTILSECNATGHCWVFYDLIAQTVNLEFTASDGYFYNSTMCGVHAEFVNLRANIAPEIYHVHAGSSFTYAIPSTVFISSATFSMTGITEGPFPVESTLAFQSPGSIVGSLGKVKTYNITIYASNIYGSAVAYVIFNVTNTPPAAIANYSANLRALVPFELTITLNSLITDMESDAIKFTIMNSGLLPSWLQSSIAPDTLSTSPQQLVLKGEATADFGMDGGQTVEMKIQVADSWNTTYTYVLLHFAGESIVVNSGASMELSTDIHPGQAFLIPFNLSYFYTLSTAWDFHLSAQISSPLNIDGLRISVPTSAIDPIAWISGKLTGSDALTPRNCTVTLMTPFGEGVSFFTIKGINRAPNLTAAATSVANPILLGTFNAKHKISVSVPISTFFSDADGDPVQFSIGSGMTGSTWLTSAISFAPGELTTAAQTMTIEGEVSALAANTNITLPIVCTDTWGSTTLEFFIIVPKVQPPVLIKPFQNLTIAPEETASTSIALADHFLSPTGDKLTGKVQVTDGGGWITTTLTGNAGKETVKVALAPTTVADYSGSVLISTTNEFGMEAQSVLNVKVVMTDWQRIQSYVELASGIIGSVLAVVGLYEYWPAIVATWKGKSIVKECPLSRQNPTYHFPEDTEEVKPFVRDEGWVFLDSISHYAYNVMTLRPPARVGPPCYLKIYDKHIGLRLNQEYDLKDPPDDCVIQIYKGDGIIMEEFEVKFKDAMGFNGPDAELLNQHAADAQMSAPAQGGAAASPPSAGAADMSQPLLQMPQNHNSSGAHAIEMQPMTQQPPPQPPQQQSAAPAVYSPQAGVAQPPPQPLSQPYVPPGAAPQNSSSFLDIQDDDL